MEYNMLLGAVGLLLLLSAFFLSTLKKVSPQASVYHFLNLSGALLLVHYAFSTKSWIFVVLELIWSLVALVGLVLVLKNKYAHIQNPKGARVEKAHF